MIDVVLARCVTLPEPDPDEAPLLSALRARGLSAASWAWDDGEVDWAQARLVLVRATWNYYEDLPRFLAWARHVASVSALRNPADVLAWTTHKRYLLALAEGGVPVVPTALVERGSEVALEDICDERGWDEIVVKPAVAAASYGAYVTGRVHPDGARFAAAVAERDMLVQPFVESVRTSGERSLVSIDGVLTHSVRKEPRLAGDDERVTGPHPIAADEAALAAAALAAVPVEAPLLYARIDIVRDAAGAPMVSELELAEPSLFLPYSDDAVARMVDAVQRVLAPSG